MNNIVTHIVLGFPSIQHNRKLVSEMVKRGVKKIELQIPFSDPLADGPVITEACHHSIKNGFNLLATFDIAKEFSDTFKETEFYFMSYFNIPFSFGINEFCKRSKRSGIKGLIIPDLPFEIAEKEGILEGAKSYGLSFIFVIPPSIEKGRLISILSRATDFIYITQISGTTGIREGINSEAFELNKKIKGMKDIKTALGFGISTSKQVKEVTKSFDYAVIGSAILQMVKEKGVKEVGEFIGDLIE